MKHLSFLLLIVLMIASCVDPRPVETLLLKDLEEYQSGDVIGILDVEATTFYATTDTEWRQKIMEIYGVEEAGEQWFITIDETPLTLDVLPIDQLEPNTKVRTGWRFVMSNRKCDVTDQLCIYDRIANKYVRVTSPPRKLCAEGYPGLTCTLRYYDLPGVFYSDTACTVNRGRQTVISARSCE